MCVRKYAWSYSNWNCGSIFFFWWSKWDVFHVTVQGWAQRCPVSTCCHWEFLNVLVNQHHVLSCWLFDERTRMNYQHWKSLPTLNSKSVFDVFKHSVFEAAQETISVAFNQTLRHLNLRQYSAWILLHSYRLFLRIEIEIESRCCIGPEDHVAEIKGTVRILFMLFVPINTSKRS